jgi:hypothetical protein
MRKTASYLNRIRLDVKSIQNAIDECGCDLEEAASKVSGMHVHDLVTDDDAFKDAMDTLIVANRVMDKLIKSFRIARENYLKFF